MVNELVDYARRAKKECLIFKVDFEKAYDSVDWGFLEYLIYRVGMCAKWVAWMKACVCGGSMSILVNGSPTEEISIHRGLKQGDPLSPFLFLLVAEGFSGLMRKAREINLVEGFQIGANSLEVTHLQYAEDTLCIGKATVENLSAMKSILRGFEMVSGLKINFFKSSLIGVNVREDFMEMACNFLNCSRGSVPFNYLGLPVGANGRSMSTWEPLVETLSRRLNSSGYKYISFGGRIVLLNSVLNSIPIFYLSFLKMPDKVWRKIVRVQREFLWGGVGGGKKISWVKWETVCQHKKRGGLGVKDIRVMNVSLLLKWRWRLLNGERTLWKDVIEEKYGPCVGSLVERVNYPWPRYSSLWWKDLVSLGDFGAEGWFNSKVLRIVGNGMNTSFWNVKWKGDRCFRLKYPRLFMLSNQRESVVGEVGVNTDVGREWLFNWRRNLFVWEEELLVSLMEDLEGMTWSVFEDVWRWNLDELGVFSVKSAYEGLTALTGPDNLWGGGG